MRAHAVYTCLKWLLGAVGIASMVSASIAQAGICPGLDHSAPPFPSVRSFEIANPQAPSKPHKANPSATGPTDLRTLMALQGQTIDLTFTMAEPIPAGCTYTLSILTAPSRASGNTILSLMPYEALLPSITSTSFPSVQLSTVTTGDNRIIFKVAPAPHLGEDKTHTLYASFMNVHNEYISETMPFKFRNLAYKILNITKEPYSYSDNSYSVNGYTLNIKLNAIPTSSSNNQFFLDMIQSAPLQTAKANSNPVNLKGLETTSGITKPDALSNLAKNGQAVKLAMVEKSSYLLTQSVVLSYGVTGLNSQGPNSLCQEFTRGRLDHCGSVTMVNNTPTVITKVNSNGNVSAILTFVPFINSNNPYYDRRPICPYPTNHTSGYCGTPVSVDLPD